MNKPMRVLVMISGGGTNLQALIDATKHNTINSEIIHVISNRKKAHGLKRAKGYGIPTTTVSMKEYDKSKEGRIKFDIDLAKKVNKINPELVILAGFMHILSKEFLADITSDIVNLHPALSNAFNGVNAIERAYKAYQQGRIAASGCMVHEVIPEVDAGNVIVNAIVPILPADTLKDFEKRMHQAEHLIIVEAMKLIEQRRS